MVNAGPRATSSQRKAQKGTIKAGICLEISEVASWRESAITKNRTEEPVAKIRREEDEVN